MCAGLGISKDEVVAKFGAGGWVGLPDVTAPREPVCRDCFEALNQLRLAMGLERWEALPGAYDAAEVE
jgi:hypothetical protein